MPIAPVVIQRRMMEVARVRLGRKGSRGQPEKLDRFRFTSASREWLEKLAAIYGGTVKEWKGAPDDGYFEVITDAQAIEVVFPPVFSADDGSLTLPCSQWLELWSGGGCQRRCDGITEAISGKPCICAPDARQCKPTTRLSFILPDVSGVGLVRLESHGWNAAAELPGTVELLLRASAEGAFIKANLRLEQRTAKSAGQTRKFVVPVIDVPDLNLGELLAGQGALAVNAPAAPPRRPELPAGDAPPAEPESLHEKEPELPDPPDIEVVDGEVVDEESAGADALNPTSASAEPSGEDRQRPNPDAGREGASPEADPTLAALRDEVLRLAHELAAPEEPAESTIATVHEKFDAAEADWLSRQVKNLTFAVNQKAANAGEQTELVDGDSYFERRAREVQEAQETKRRKR